MFRGVKKECSVYCVSAPDIGTEQFRWKLSFEKDPGPVAAQELAPAAYLGTGLRVF